MQRRDLLRGGSIALALTIAGCTSGDDTEEIDDGNGNADDTDEGNGNGDTEENADESEDGTGDEDGDTEDSDTGDGNGDDGGDEEESEDDTDDQGGEEPEGEASLEIVSEELSVEEGEFATDAWVEFVVENSGDGNSGEIAVNAEWYDDGGDFLGDATERMVGLGAGESWVERVYALTEAEDVADFELAGEFATEAPAPAPDGLEFLEGEIQEDDQVTFNGRVENTTGEEVGYVEANVKFYDGEGNVLGSQWTNETDLPADATWSFDVTWLDRRRADQVEDFEVFLADSAW